MPGLEDLYREIILDHYRTPRNRGELEPPAIKADGHNPLCGDEITVYLDLDTSAGTGDDAVIRDIKIGGQGCSISQSSASMMSQAMLGKSVGDVNARIRRFKTLMGIEGLDEDRERCRHRPRRPRSAAGRCQVPGSHQVCGPQLEHPGPSPHPSRIDTGPNPATTTGSVGGGRAGQRENSDADRAARRSSEVGNSVRARHVIEPAEQQRTAGDTDQRDEL